jgi:hypothetical protein
VKEEGGGGKEKEEEDDDEEEEEEEEVEKLAGKNVLEWGGYCGDGSDVLGQGPTRNLRDLRFTQRCS